VIVLLGLSFAEHTGVPQDWFRKFLAAKVFVIPDQTLANNVSLLNISCTNSRWESMQTNFVPPDRMESMTSGITFQCKASWEHMGKAGSLVINAKNSTDMSIDGTLPPTKDDPPTPKNLTIPFCNFNVSVYPPVVNGNPPAAVQKELKDKVPALIANVYPQVICTEGAHGISSYVTNIIELADSFMKAFFEDPLVPIPEPEMPANVTLVNWHDSDTIEALGHLVDDPDFLNIITNALTDNTGNISFSVPNPQPTELFNVSFGVISGNISGLDNFESFSILDPVGKHSLNSTIELGKVGLSLDIFAVLEDGTRYNTRLKLQLADIKIIASALLAVHPSFFDSLRVGQLSDFKCLSSNIYSVQFEELSVELDISTLALEGLSPSHGELDALISAGLAATTYQYASFLEEVIRGIIGRPLMKTVNKKLQAAFPNSNKCKPLPLPRPDTYVNYQTSPIFSALTKILNGKAPKSSNYDSTIDALIDYLTRDGVRGGFHIPGPLFPAIKVGNISVIVHDLTLTGLDSFSDFALLVPTGPQSLHTKLTLGAPNSINASLLVDIDGLMFPLPNTSVVLQLADLYLLLDSEIKFNTGRFAGLWVEQVSRPTCLLSALQDFHISKWDLELKNLSLTAADIPILDWEVPKTPEVLNHLFSGLLQAQIENLEYAAPYLCNNQTVPPAPTPAPSFLDGTFAHDLGAVAVSLAVVLAILILVRYIRKDDGTERKDFAVTGLEQALLSGQTSQALGLRVSLIFEPTIPALFRYGMPVVILANCIIFITANVGTGADVAISYVDDKGVIHELQSLFTFNLANSVRDMWKAHVYALSLFIAIFSGAWAYAKPLLCLVCWVLPPHMLSTARRERCLILLDALGKWSLVDAYVLVMMMVAFRTKISLYNYELDVIVNPGYGFYAFLAGAIVSLATSHVILHLHRHVMGTGGARIPHGGRKESVQNHNYLKGRLDDGSVSRRFPGYQQKVVTFLLMFCMAAIIFACNFDAISFEFEGAAGVVLQGKTTYSMVSLGQKISESTRHPNGFGIRTIQTTYFIFALGAPLCFLICLLLLWVVPMRLKTQYRVYTAAEIFQAWSTLDVFISSVLAAMLQLSTFAGFLVGDKCDAINPLLKKLLDVDTCFQVSPVLEHGTYILLGAAAILIGTGQLVIRHALYALNDRYVEVGIVAPCDVHDPDDESYKKEFM